MFAELGRIFCDWHCPLEILILFLAIYAVLYYLRNTRGSMVMAGLLFALTTLWGLTKLLNLTIMGNLLEILFGSMMLMLMIIFQPELRRALSQVGSLPFGKKRRQKELIGEIVLAVQDMAARKCGALIVIEKKIRLQPQVDDSIALDAKVNALLLESIFYPNSALHDGAVIIRDERIVAARVILPLTRAENISRRLGTRHRAALGISEESDAVAVMVSEETGMINIAYHGSLQRDLSGERLRTLLDEMLIRKDDEELSETIWINAVREEEDGQTELPFQDLPAARTPAVQEEKKI